MFKNKIVMLTVILLIGITLIGGTAFVLWYMLYHKDVPTDGSKAAEEAVATVEPVKPTLEELAASTVDFEEITTTLKSGNFIKLKLSLRIDNPKQLEAFKKTQFLCQDIIMRTLADTNAEEIQGEKGIGELSSKIMNKINNELADTKVEQVYVTSIMIQ